MTEIQFKIISPKELASIQSLHFSNIFSNRSTGESFDVSPEAQKLIGLRKASHQPWELLVGIYAGEQAIGWHIGHASDAETFYMKNSAIIQNYRNQKIYHRLLDFILNHIASEGFQVVTSIHHGNNPAVLIPKLKKGFVISGTQFHEKFRFLVELKYFFDPERKKAYGRSMGLEL